MKNKILIAVSCAVLLLLGSMLLFASSKHGIFVTQDGRRMIATDGAARVTASAEAKEDAKLVTIASNLSDYPYATFFCCFGWTVAGPNSQLGFTSWIAVPFTPSSNINVTKLEVAVGYYTPNVPVTLSVAQDSGGLPGNTLKSFNASVGFQYGSCCTLVKASSSTGVPVTGGTQYWLVAGTSSKNPTFFGGWSDNSTDMRPHPFAGYCKSNGNQCGNNNGKWAAANALLPGYAVLGK